jgi:hypothetical protein
MKVFAPRWAAAAMVLAVILTAAVPTTGAQTALQTVGTLSGLSPDTILVRSTASGELVRYVSTQTTMYVDETGAPLISIDSLNVGIPVTVQYIKVADQLVASRVSLGNALTVGPTEKTKAPVATTK